MTRALRERESVRNFTIVDKTTCKYEIAQKLLVQKCFRRDNKVINSDVRVRSSVITLVDITRMSNRRYACVHFTKINSGVFDV